MIGKIITFTLGLIVGTIFGEVIIKFLIGLL